MSMHNTDDWDAVTEMNARTVRRIDTAANIAVALLLGILGAWALLAYLTPCEAGQLCMAAAIPTQPSLVQRLRLAMRAWRLRWQLTETQNALAHVEKDLQELPELECYLRHRVDVLLVGLADCELGARRN